MPNICVTAQISTELSRCNFTALKSFCCIQVWYIGTQLCCIQLLRGCLPRYLYLLPLCLMHLSVPYYISSCIQETATPLHRFFLSGKSAFHRAFRMPLLRQTISLSASALTVHTLFEHWNVTLLCSCSFHRAASVRLKCSGGYCC